MKNILDEEVTCNILIRADPEKTAHKMKGSKDDPCLCWWTVGKKPKRKGIYKVQFTDGKKIYAEGKFLGTATDGEKPCIEFDPLNKVNKKLKKKAPTRGFTYVED